MVKRRVLTCCEAVKGIRDPEQVHCGSQGYGFKWVQGNGQGRFWSVLKNALGPGIFQVDQGSSAHSAREKSAAVQALWLAVISVLCAALLALSRGLFDRKRRRGVVTMSHEDVVAGFAGFGVVGFGTASLLGEKILFMSPLGWMRISSVFCLYLICLVILRGAQLWLGPGHAWTELNKYGLFVIVVFAQEKLLWSPIGGLGIPVLSACCTVGLGTLLGPTKAKAQTYTVVSFALCLGIALILLCPQLSVIEIPATARLYYSTAWPIIAIAISEVLRTKGSRHRIVALLASVIALYWLAPQEERDELLFLRRAKFGHGGHFCCLDARDTSQCRSGHRWFHRNERETEPAWAWEIWAMLWTTVLTNLTGLGPTAFAWQTAKVPFSAALGLATFWFSSLYHLADTIDDRFMGMTEGNWHRLDNLFAILSFCQLQLFFLDASISFQVRDSLRAFFLLFTVTLQEIGPWQLECTLVPILAASLVLVYYLSTNALVRQTLKASLASSHDFKYALVLGLLGIAGFIKGLDQDKDYLRFGHGCWHLFMGTSAYFSYKAYHAAILSARRAHEKIA